MRTWFLSSEYPECPAERGYFHVIPVPLERTVSYGSGTAAGPQAILEASAQLETIVESYGQPGSLGIHTTEPIDCTSDAIATVFASIARRIGHAWSLQAIPILLGGEHSITNGAIAAIASCHPPGEVGILQFDAHMDLRHAYEGTVHSHGSVMRRALEKGIRLHQVGIRNYSVEELEARSIHGVTYHDASQLNRLRHTQEHFSSLALPQDFPGKLYVSFDVDGFDAALMSATGTPDPGGFGWWEAVELLERLTEGRTIIGADVVELAPQSHLHHCDYTVAKLTYFLIALIARRDRSLHDHTSS